MSEANDFKPAKWSRGHDFNQARRSYGDKNRYNLLEKTVRTECENPLIIVSDVTGSMGEWPGIMFGKLPYLEYEAKEYLGDDLEICWAAFRDAHTRDSHPLQVRPFTKGKKHLDRLTEIVRGGGSNPRESSELAAAYFANNCEMPNAINPVLIFISDDTIYETLTPSHAKQHAKVDLKKEMSKEQLFTDLKQKYDVYFIQKVTQVRGNEMYGNDKNVYDCWAPLVGTDHVVPLSDPDRVVDCIFGILGKATGRRDYSEEELKHRQLQDDDGPEKVETVLRATQHLYKDDSSPKRTKTSKLL